MNTTFSAKSQLKLVFTGSVGAGKTSAIGAISEVRPFKTDVKSTENGLHRTKVATTVAMDYGELTLDNNIKLHLYGTPGQRRFDFMSGILCKGALGLIILIDNAHPDSLGELDYYVNLNAGFLRKAPAVIGITHCDESPTPTVTHYSQALAARGMYWPVMQTDARQKDKVVLLVESLLATLEYA